jgi:hypothetical protein
MSPSPRATRALLMLALLGVSASFAAAAGETCTSNTGCASTEECQCDDGTTASDGTVSTDTTDDTDTVSPGFRARTPLVTMFDTSKLVATAAFGALFAQPAHAATCTCVDITGDLTDALAVMTFEPQTPIQTITASSSKKKRRSFRRRDLLAYAFEDVQERKMMEDPTSTLFAFPNNIFCALIEASGYMATADGWNTAVGEGKTMKATISVENCPWESAAPPTQVWVVGATVERKYVDETAETGAYNYATIDIWIDRKGAQDLYSLDVRGRAFIAFAEDPNDADDLIVKSIEFQFDAPSVIAEKETHVGFIKKAVAFNATDWTAASASATSETIEFVHKWSFPDGSIVDNTDAAIIVTDLVTGVTDARGSYLDTDNSEVVADMLLRDDGTHVKIVDGQTVCLDKATAFETGYKYNLYDTSTGAQIDISNTMYDASIDLGTNTITDYSGNAVTPSGIFFEDMNRNVGTGFGCRTTDTRVATSVACTDTSKKAFFMSYKIPDGVTATLSNGRVCGNAGCVDPGTYPHDGKTYHVKSVVGKTIVPATTSTECDGVSTATAAALVVPTIAGWTSTIYADVGATPTATPTVTLLYGVVQ